MSVALPRLNGPPLNALRAFEAAARLGGFTLAAQELCVTPGAISQHVKSLEDWAGVTLFERRSQGVMVTDEGKDVAHQLSEAFDKMNTSIRLLKSKSASTTIHIAALPSVAQLWLAPRLPAIRAALPNTTISIRALESRPNMDREMFDLSVFFAEPEGLQNEIILAPDQIFPVCTPEIAARLSTPDDLLVETCLYDAVWADDWEQWFNISTEGSMRPRPGPSFSLYSIALDEARNGAGVLIAHKVLVEKYIRSGELVAPFSEKADTGKCLILQLASRATSSRSVLRLVSMLTD